jgi:hypothetical protein
MGEKWPINFAYSKCRDLLHAANLRHGTDGFTSPPKKGMLRIFSTASAGFEPTNLGTTRPLKPTITSLTMTTQRLKHVPVHLYTIIIKSLTTMVINPLNAKLNPIYHLLSLLGSHHILHISRIRVNNCSVTYTTYQGDQDKK